MKEVGINICIVEYIKLPFKHSHRVNLIVFAALGVRIAS